MRLFLLDPCSVLVRGQGVLLLLEGGLGITHCHFLLLKGFALFLEGPGERGDGRLLALELGLLALELGLLALELGFLVLELGLLALELGFLLLERRPSALQLGGLRLGFPSLLLHCGSLDVTLGGGPRELLL